MPSPVDSVRLEPQAMDEVCLSYHDLGVALSSETVSSAPGPLISTDLSESPAGTAEIGILSGC